MTNGLEKIYQSNSIQSSVMDYQLKRMNDRIDKIE